MGVPQKRRSYTRRLKRRTHHALKQTSSSICPECDLPLLPHKVCDKGFECYGYDTGKSKAAR